MAGKRLKIDRSSTWSLGQMSSISDDRVVRVWENPLASALTELDVDEIELLPLLEGGVFPEALTEEQLRNDILGKLQAYQDKGYVLLDGAVVASLLTNKDQVPRLWLQMTESEAWSDISAAIRFDGSVFRLIDRPDERVLSPFASRGQYGFGYQNRFPSLPEANRSQFLSTRELTAAIKV